MLRIMWCTANYRGPSLIFHSFSLEKRNLGSHLPRQLFTSRSFQPVENMSAKATINKEVFVPHDEKMLAAVQVKRRTKKKIPFLATGGQGDYMTFICLSGQGTNEHFFLSLPVCIYFGVYFGFAVATQSHFNTSAFIFTLVLKLMSVLTFLLTIRQPANTIHWWPLGHSF